MDADRNVKILDKKKLKLCKKTRRNGHNTAGLYCIKNCKYFRQFQFVYNKIPKLFDI